MISLLNSPLLKNINFFIWIVAVLATACNKMAVPANFPAVNYDLSSNPLTEEGITLGRKLFYDPLLSANNTISCGSCHIQGSAFTHHGHSVSHGIDASHWMLNLNKTV